MWEEHRRSRRSPADLREAPDPFRGSTQLKLLLKKIGDDLEEWLDHL
jgi:hypothetical protein